MAYGTYRALYSTARNRLFAVIGSGFFEITYKGISKQLGVLNTSVGNCSIAENETQLLIVDGKDGWTFDLSSNTFEQVSTQKDMLDTVGFDLVNGGSGYGIGDVLTLATPSGGTAGTVTVTSIDVDGRVITALVTQKGRGYSLTNYATTGGTGTGAIATVESLTDSGFESGKHVINLDGFFIKTKLNSGQFQWSYLRDGKTWDALNYATAEGSPDDLISIAKINNELFLFGGRTTEIWFDTGNSESQFQRINQGYLDIGCAAEWSVATLGNQVFWLGSSQQGQGIVWSCSNYVPQRVSTHAVEYTIGQIAKKSTIADAEAYCYQQEGHFFYVLTFPSGNKTLVYDAKDNLWHERAYWDKANGNYTRHLGKCFAYWNNKNYVSDYRNTNLYELDLDTYTDNGDEIRRVRTGGHIRKDRNRLFFWGFELDLERGVGVQGVTEVVKRNPTNPYGLVYMAGTYRLVYKESTNQLVYSF